MPRIEMDLDTAASPEQVLAAVTDFTENRTKIWRDLAPELYEVYSVGETFAEVKEGSSKPVKVWAREHYDWSQPNEVTWTVVESNFCKPGSYVSAEISPGADGGTHVHVIWSREGSNFKGRLIVRMLKLTKGKPIVKSVKRNLDALAG
jgi:hypothetical protein